MTKRTAQWLIIAGIALQAADLLTNGKVFGPGGVLYSINQKLPSFTIGGMQSNLAWYLIAVGGIGYLL